MPRATTSSANFVFSVGRFSNASPTSRADDSSINRVPTLEATATALLACSSPSPSFDASFGAKTEFLQVSFREADAFFFVVDFDDPTAASNSKSMASCAVERGQGHQLLGAKMHPFRPPPNGPTGRPLIN
ncbi:hypothetical protein KM043_000811 [Ampulex compressa]|nr:hypothetical protein KM043_000811 [Ampulex compressa]